ncbi:hypothetical protein D3C78_1457230 [compost metagenome]
MAEERYSFPLFCACDYDTLIEPVASLVEKHGRRPYEPVVCGEHLYAQTIQTFGYLKRRLEAGELSLPNGARGLSSYGRKSMAEEA